MAYSLHNPLVVQSDKTVLLEVDNEQYESARDALARFAELEKSPEYIHTYRITPLSLWNAAAAGLTAPAIIAELERYSKYPLPDNIRVDIADAISRYGRVKLTRSEKDGYLALISDDVALMTELAGHKLVAPLIDKKLSPTHFLVTAVQRGHIKRVLLQVGYPAEDLAGYVEGAPLEFRLRERCQLSGEPFVLRHYQTGAADVFYAGGSVAGGSGVIVLPCGAGKTMVGMAVMARLQTATLILTPSTVAVRQWIAELLDKTDLDPKLVGEYSGLKKEVRPVTVSTYQVVTYRPRGRKGRPLLEEFPHFNLFNQLDWGLVIYDEVHLLPAPVFRITAEIQARRRLGLTATLVREDGQEGEVFSLVGPKKYDVPWKDLEQQGWIATAECHEIRIPFDQDRRMEYALTGDKLKYHFAATNEAKLPVVRQLVAKHGDDTILVIGMYLDQLERIAHMLNAPLITGETPVRQREKLFEQMRHGALKTLVISKVGNFSIDLPDANVMIQVSGTFGSRQEEAQRLGRILRPKRNGLLAHFYALVTHDSLDQDYSARRQLFLTEQGYRYDILYEHEVPDWQPATLATEAAQAHHHWLPRHTANGAGFQASAGEAASQAVVDLVPVERSACAPLP
ncbi:MAG: DEAD/DEAH box helicase [Thermoflexales bacterium]|nr:DEAD/DEAH box helicase [Thermoflexales bacterium]